MSVYINPDRSEQSFKVMLKNASTSNWYKFNSSGIYWYHFIVIITIIIIIQFKFISSVNVCTLFPLYLHSLHWLFLIRNIRDLQLWNPKTFLGFLSPFAIFTFVCCAFMLICFSGWSLHWGPGVASIFNRVCQWLNNKSDRIVNLQKYAENDPRRRYMGRKLCVFRENDYNRKCNIFEIHL